MTIRPLLTLVMVCLMTGLVFSYLAMALLPALFDLNVAELIDNTAAGYPVIESARTAMALFLAQGLSSLGFFVLPGWWFFQNHRELLQENHRELLQARFGFGVSAWLGGMALTILCLPMVYNLFHLNQGLPYSRLAEAYPAIKRVSLDWQATEQSSQQLLTVLMKPDGILYGLIGVVVLALLPAFGEELVFRGSLQPLIQQQLRNPHAGVWVSALLFSAIHGQWLGFVPRCLLGALFGYLVLWSGSVWPAIMGHFCNNLLSFLAYKLNWWDMRNSQVLSETTFRWEDNPFPWYIALILMGLAIAGLVHYRKTFSRINKDQA
ncbi:MAG: CPBP family intramembrane metalloprotease [Sphingomonadales bacterium]|nr:CPBP family intramembrane metalloprotease [Sphingomonadales bacterium]MBM3931548.1 CPBP family intramembrane metalloprotease [Sphingomonadales bacterium]